MEKEKIIRFSSIFLINLGIKGLIDFGIAPVIVASYGYFVCFCVLTMVYLLVGIISISIYDNHKSDFLFVESLKEAMEKNNPVFGYNRLIRFIIRKSNGNKKRPFLIMLLSFKNPGLAVIYMRDGYYLYDGFAKDWTVFYFFIVNIFIMNIYFTIVLYTGFSIWKILVGFF